MKKSVACKDNFLVAVLHEPADAVLGVTGRIQALDSNAFAKLGGLAVARRLRDRLAILAADDGQFGEVQHLALDAVSARL